MFESTLVTIAIAIVIILVVGYAVIKVGRSPGATLAREAARRQEAMAREAAKQAAKPRPPARDSYEVPVAKPDIKVVSPNIGQPNETAKRWYMAAPVVKLLAAIREHESGKTAAAYNVDYGGDDRWTLIDKTFNKVRELGRSQVTGGGARGGKEPSSAIGAYQFLTATLDSLKASLGLSGTEIFDAELQDDLAVALMIRRGFLDYLAGEMDAETFCNNLAKEWASLPVVKGTQGQKRWVSAGQSYYSGDGLNKAFHSPDKIQVLVREMRTPDMIANAKKARKK
jgi:muramidase (phage lysozyme)